ncbi:MAG: alpha/beta fold hydrolase [Lachnospiraceae bacterium]
MNWSRRFSSYIHEKNFLKSAFIISVATFIIYVFNKIIFFISTLDDILGKSDGNYYEWRFGKVFYKVQGKGNPLLLIHDLSSSSSSFEWNKIVCELSKTNTVYTLDLLGCGRSDKPALTYTNFLYVQLITDFIKNVIKEKTDVIVTGESSSFIIAACKNDSNIINRIVLVNPLDIAHLSLVPSKRTQILKILIYIPIIGTLLYHMLMRKESIEDKFFEDFYNTSGMDERTIKAYYEAAHLGNSKGKYLFANMKARYTNFDIGRCLRTLNNSIFIITGDGTPNNSTIADQYSSILPSIEIVGIDKTKQLPQLERPDAFLEQINILLSY